MCDALGEALGDEIVRRCGDDRDGGRHAIRRKDALAQGNDEIDFARDELGRKHRHTNRLPVGESLLDQDGLALDVAEPAEPVPKGPGDPTPFFVGARIRKEKPDPRDARRLLRPASERPSRCTDEQADNLAPSHSITSSAAPSKIVGMSIPSALAVLRLTIVLKIVVRSIGMSPGFAPLRILSTKVAA